MTGPSTDISIMSLSPLEEFLKDPTNSAWISSFTKNHINGKIDIVASIKQVDSDSMLSKTAFLINVGMTKIYKLDLHSKDLSGKNTNVYINKYSPLAPFNAAEIKIQGTLIPLTEAEKFLCNVKGITFDE